MEKKQKSIPVHQLSTYNMFTIERIEHCDAINFDGIHRHNFYEILCFTEVKDGDKHTIDFIDYPLSTNTVYLLKPGQVYKMRYEYQRGFMVAIYPSFFSASNSKIFTTLYFPNCIPLTEDEEFRQVLSLMNLIMYEYEQKKRDSLLYSFLNSLLTMLEVYSKRFYNKNQTDEQIYYLLSLIENHYKEEHNAKFYAEEMSMGSKTLNRFCSKYFGNPIKKMLQERLLLEAKRRIATTSSTFQEIAFDLGFKDASYFTRFFKQREANTPEQFKNSL